MIEKKVEGGGGRNTFTAVKVPKQCPLVLPVKTGLERRQGLQKWRR
jgi:hypothetical protein